MYNCHGRHGFLQCFWIIGSRTCNIHHVSDFHLVTHRCSRNARILLSWQHRLRSSGLCICHSNKVTVVSFMEDDNPLSPGLLPHLIVWDHIRSYWIPGFKVMVWRFPHPSKYRILSTAWHAACTTLIWRIGHEKRCTLYTLAKRKKSS